MSNNLKKPFTPSTLEAAKVNYRSTWGTFAHAANRVSERKAQGVGFEFDGNGIVGIDLDHCLNTALQRIIRGHADIELVIHSDG